MVDHIKKIFHSPRGLLDHQRKHYKALTICDIAFDFDLAPFVQVFLHSFDAEQRKCVSRDFRWKQCS